MMHDRLDDEAQRSGWRRALRFRLWFARILWRAAFVLLAAGGQLLRFRLIGPVGMRRIWHCADTLEHCAEGLRRLP